jgi:glycosyltransferase involved in cell wall biosynthesis
VCSWAPDTEALPPVDTAPDEALVVDSLLVRHDDALPPLRRAHAGPLVLLAHYLHCIDPRVADTAAARTERAVLPLFDGALTTSRYAQRALVREGLPPGRVSTVPPGLDDAYRAPPTSPPDGPPVLLTVANLLPGKGLDSFVDQLDALQDQDWRWILVGDDTLDPAFAEALTAQVRNAAIADRVTMTGPLAPDDMRAWYDHSHLFVLPSRFETCSMSTREALARARPVVGYDVGGMRDNLGDADAGRLVPPDAPEALVDALRTLLTAPDTRAAMGRAAREQSTTFPTWATAAARVRSFLQSL